MLIEWCFVGHIFFKLILWVQIIPDPIELVETHTIVENYNQDSFNTFGKYKS